MFTLQKFVYQENIITVLIDKEGNSWFDAPAVCNILGYARSAVAVLERLDDDEKILLDRKEFESTPDCTPDVQSGNLRSGAVKKWFVNEPGLYSLILGSEKPEAKQFKRWITHEVLPAIRKTGSYTANEQVREAPENEKKQDGINRAVLNAFEVIATSFGKIIDKVNYLTKEVAVLRNSPAHLPAPSQKKDTSKESKSPSTAELFELARNFNQERQNTVSIINDLAEWKQNVHPTLCNVLERLTAMENRQNAQATNSGLMERVAALETGMKAKQASLEDIIKDIETSKKILEVLGIEGNQAVLAATKLIRQKYGIDLELALPAEKQEQLYTPTQLGHMIGISAKQVNERLQNAGLQTKEGKIWNLTDTGKEFAEYLDVSKKKSDGTLVRQIKWHSTVLNLIKG